MGLNVGVIEVFLLVAAIVSMVARRLRLPYTVGLVLAGAFLAFSPISQEITLTKELVFSILLPPLIFEAAFDMQWKDLKKDLAPVLVLASVGILLSAAFAGVAFKFIAGWAWAPALLFGVLISPTDPVSVIATFKELGVQGRLRMLVESESLFNDGMAAVLFGLAFTYVQGIDVSGPGVSWYLIKTVAGGIAVGALVGWLMLLIAGRTEDHLVEITFTTVAAFGSFLLAEHWHLSGVLATLTAGLMLGNVGSLGAISDRGHEAVHSFWEYAGFAANSMIFLLIGVRLAIWHSPPDWGLAAAAVILALIARAISVYGASALFVRSRSHVPTSTQHVLFWGGLRGALSLALALGLPESVPHRDEIVTLTFIVVLFSVVVQGLTITPLMSRLGLLGQEREHAASP